MQYICVREMIRRRQRLLLPFTLGVYAAFPLVVCVLFLASMIANVARRAALMRRALPASAGQPLRPQFSTNAYHPAEPEMEHSVVTLDSSRRPVNPPGLFSEPGHLVNEAAAANKANPSDGNRQQLKEALAAEDAEWMQYLQQRWPTLADKKAAVHKANGSEASMKDFNEHLAKVMAAEGYKLDSNTGEWGLDLGDPNHVSNAGASAQQARWSLAAAGVQMAATKELETHRDRVAFRNLNARRLAKQGAKSEKGGGKAKTVSIAGDSVEWEAADAEFDKVTSHLGECAPLFVEDSRVVVPGDISARVISSDASAILMAHNVLEAYPASKQQDNFLNGAKAINVYLSPDLKDAQALVGVEDDGSSRVALTGSAVSEATLRAALAISAEAFAPAAEEA